ncbi:MAG: 9-O-acetylesterase [Phycisphaerae bacterium]|nr:9-O-acetylesterase [Phycisphaerae bacterium]
MRHRFGLSLIVAVVSLADASVLVADVSVPHVFAAHMVLQRDRALPVWGWAEPGEKVTVRLGEQSATAQAGNDGAWKVSLPAMGATTGLTMTVVGKNTLTFEDVAVGEVWVCSGQSNMAWGVGGSDNAKDEIAAANHPNIRLFKVPNVLAGFPQRDLNATWQRCSPETVGGFSAVGYFFGRKLNKDLDVPVGLIDSSWGGSLIEPWTPPAGFASVRELVGVSRQINMADPASEAHKARLTAYLGDLEKWIGTARQALSTEKELAPAPAYPNELNPLAGWGSPTAMYNAMIHPLVPYSIRGGIWYQGESNRLDAMLYAKKKEALVTGWRKVWGAKAEDFPFYWVQLAPFIYGGDSPDVLAKMWEAQAAATAIPNTGMAVINDIGNLKDIHPTNKQDVGLRLALIALANTYGKQGIVWSGPVYKSMEIEGDKIRLRFDHVGGGLASRDGKPLSWFEIMGEQTGYVPAKAEIDGDTVVVSSPEVKKAAAVRFAWRQDAVPNLMNKEGLPVSAFRAGTFPGDVNLARDIPQAKGYVPVYTLLIPDGANYASTPPDYVCDKHAEIKTPFDRIGYLLQLKKKDGALEQVFVSMDAFTKDASKIGVPCVATGTVFHQDVAKMTIVSNVKGVAQGEGIHGGIEFWASNYGPENKRNIPDASSKDFDFGDTGGTATAGYGSMQIHNHDAKATVFAFNRWGADGVCDLGIGNQPEKNPDWTFANNANQYVLKRLQVLVRPAK